MTHLPDTVIDELDSKVHALQARWSASLSTESLYLAFVDWLSHLMRSPGKRFDLIRLALKQMEILQSDVASFARPGDGMLQSKDNASTLDRRFADPAWMSWPFNLFARSFLLQQQWWHEATTDIHGVSAHHENVMDFVARQWLDMFSPGNFFWTNPVVLRRTRQQGGQNLVRGAWNWMEDVARYVSGIPAAGTERFVVGRDVAATPGKVVLRNHLIELIQYAPVTQTVRPEPILIVPAWIMKYYILDLSPDNSLVRYLVDNGYTVFCISWRNPGRADAGLGMDDYLNLGVSAALDAIGRILPDQRVHATGYCLGGTLLSIAAAAMARDGDKRLASLTLLAAQTDFTEPGELALFIDESQVALLEDQMQQAGYLTAAQMAGAFEMLRSYDLLWSRMLNDYLLGERRPPNDLMAWNADTTRMPATMHSQYLRHLYLNNDLSEGRYMVNGRPVELKEIAAPVFCVGTESDHVAPWRSVYKVHHLFTNEITFVLTNGGHNAGIVNEPGHPHRHYKTLVQRAGAPALAPEEWLASAKTWDGSWWIAWKAWLDAHSGERVPPPPMGMPGGGAQAFPSAPGQYVLEK